MATSICNIKSHLCNRIVQTNLNGVLARWNFRQAVRINNPLACLPRKRGVPATARPPIRTSSEVPLRIKQMHKHNTIPGHALTRLPIQHQGLLLDCVALQHSRTNAHPRHKGDGRQSTCGARCHWHKPKYSLTHAPTAIALIHNHHSRQRHRLRKIGG